MVRDTLIRALAASLEAPVETPLHRRAVAEARTWLGRVECLLIALQADAAEPAVASEATELLAQLGCRGPLAAGCREAPTRRSSTVRELP